MDPRWNIRTHPSNAVGVITEFPVMINWEAVRNPAAVEDNALSAIDWNVVRKFREALIQGKIELPEGLCVRLSVLSDKY